jgi:hypothetical protein
VSKKRDDIAAALMGVPSPWPVAPGEAPVMVIPPNERDAIERAPVSEGYDANAIQGDDLMRQRLWPQDYLQEEEV